MKSTIHQILRISAVVAIVFTAYSLSGCVGPGYAPRNSDSRHVPAEGPEASLHSPGEDPGPSSKMDLIKTAQRQQKFIRAARSRITELENQPPETSEQADSLPSDERLLQMSPAKLRKVTQRQQEMIDILKRRVDELEKKT